MDEQRKQFELALEIVRFNGMTSHDALDLAEWLMACGYTHESWVVRHLDVTHEREDDIDLSSTGHDEDEHTFPPADLVHPPEAAPAPLPEPTLDVPVRYGGTRSYGPDNPPPINDTNRGTARMKDRNNAIQYGTPWTDPTNTEIPPEGMPRRWSGWSMNKRQRDTMLCFTGETGRVIATPTWIAKHARYDKSSIKPGAPPRKSVYARQAPNSLVRRGLLELVDRDLYQLTPRGRVFVREVLGKEPTPKHTGVQSSE